MAVNTGLEELVIQMISNAPAVVVLLYIVIRLDRRLEELQECMIELLRNRGD